MSSELYEQQQVMQQDVTQQQQEKQQPVTRQQQILTKEGRSQQMSQLTNFGARQRGAFSNESLVRST